MSSKRKMTPIHTDPSPRSSPLSSPPAAPSRPGTAPNLPASTASSRGLVERPYAPVLPPSTNSQEQETVEALVGLRQLSPTSANLTTSFSAINVAIPNGLPNSYTRTSYDYSSNISSPVTQSNEYSPDTTEDTRSADASSTRSRRRRRSNSVGVESPRDHTKPYDGHVLKEDTVMGDASESPPAHSPLNKPQAPQRDSHPAPQPSLPTSMAVARRENKSKQHSHSQRQQLPPPHLLLPPGAQLALVYQPQQPIARYSKQSNRPQMPIAEPLGTYSTDMDGYKVLRGAVSIESVQAAANILDHGMEKVRILPTHKVFGLSVQAFGVRDEFIRNVSAYLLYPPSVGSHCRSCIQFLNSYTVKPTILEPCLCQSRPRLPFVIKIRIFQPFVLSDIDITGGLPRSRRLSSTTLHISQGPRGYQCV